MKYAILLLAAALVGGCTAFSKELKTTDTESEGPPVFCDTTPINQPGCYPGSSGPTKRYRVGHVKN